MRIAEILFENQQINWLSSPLFNNTYKDKTSTVPGLSEKFRQFKELKQANPLGLFGRDDRPFKSGGFFDNAVPKLRKAHLTPDHSIVYRLSGNNINLYGIFTHDDLGVGQPPNINRQRNMATKFAHAEFSSGIPDVPTSSKTQSQPTTTIRNKVDYTPKVRPGPPDQAQQKTKEIEKLASVIGEKWPQRNLAQKMEQRIMIKQD